MWNASEVFEIVNRPGTFRFFFFARAKVDRRIFSLEFNVRQTRNANRFVFIEVINEIIFTTQNTTLFFVGKGD